MWINGNFRQGKAAHANRADQYPKIRALWAAYNNAAPRAHSSALPQNRTIAACILWHGQLRHIYRYQQNLFDWLVCHFQTLRQQQLFFLFAAHCFAPKVYSLSAGGRPNRGGKWSIIYPIYRSIRADVHAQAHSFRRDVGAAKCYVATKQWLLHIMQYFLYFWACSGFGGQSYLFLRICTLDRLIFCFFNHLCLSLIIGL
jgi:hypothetical protein